MSKISEYAAITGAPNGSDVLPIVDVTDTSMAPSGTTKKITVTNLLTAITASDIPQLADYAPTGQTGATAASRYVGATTSGAPVSGSFSVGDFVVDQTGKIWVCTAAGSPGTWVSAGSTLDSTAADFQPDGVAAAGSTAKGADAGHVHPLQAWQFLPESYGAKGDGKVLGDVVTNSTTTITSATAAFTAADVGKHIMIHGALGTSSGPLLTTISSVTNSTTAVLASAATASVSNCPAVYGTDDTSAIQQAVTAAGNYATAHAYFGEVVFGGKIYILASGPTQSGNGSTTVTFNSQVNLPYPNANNTTQKLIIALTGVAGGGYLQYWNSLIPNVAGTALVSMTTAPNPVSGTFGAQSVIGGPTGSAGFGGSPAYANTKVVVKGINVWCPIWTNLYAFDFGYISAMRAEQSGAYIFAPTGVNASAVAPYLNNITAAGLTNAISVGWRTPVTSNNADIFMSECAVEGYEIGFLLFDHLDGHKLNAIYNDVCMKFDGGQGASGTAHGIFVSSITAEVYNGGFRQVGGTVQVNICWDSENTGVTYDVSGDNGLRGVLRFRDPSNARFPTVSGAANLKVICDELGPGHWSSPPAVPTSTVAQQNTAWRDATVLVSGGTVTQVAIDGTNTGLTSGMFRVPSGKNITLTYSVAPTWTWWLD